MRSATRSFHLTLTPTAWDVRRIGFARRKDTPGTGTLLVQWDSGKTYYYVGIPRFEYYRLARLAAENVLRRADVLGFRHMAKMVVLAAPVVRRIC